MENDFLDGIYWEDWYNRGNVEINGTMNPACNENEQRSPKNPKKDSKKPYKGPCPIPLRERLIMYSNRLLGVPRLRQLRVTNQSCLIPQDFEKAIKVKL